MEQQQGQWIPNLWEAKELARIEESWSVLGMMNTRPRRKGINVLDLPSTPATNKIRRWYGR